MLKILLAAVAGMILGMVVVSLSLHTKPPQITPQAAMECPPGLAEQAAKKDAEHARAQAGFEALKKVTK